MDGFDVGKWVMKL